MKAQGTPVTVESAGASARYHAQEAAIRGRQISVRCSQARFAYLVSVKNILRRSDVEDLAITYLNT